jgi:hypothetical protein
MSLDPRLTALLEKNKDVITNYQKFLAVTDNPNYKQSVQAYSHMQTMLNGVFAGNNNFAALKTICPQLSQEMENKQFDKANQQVEHSQRVKNHPLLG